MSETTIVEEKTTKYDGDSEPTTVRVRRHTVISYLRTQFNVAEFLNFADALRRAAAPDRIQIVIVEDGAGFKRFSASWTEQLPDDGPYFVTPGPREVHSPYRLPDGGE